VNAVVKIGSHRADSRYMASDSPDLSEHSDSLTSRLAEALRNQDADVFVAPTPLPTRIPTRMPTSLAAPVPGALSDDWESDDGDNRGLFEVSSEAPSTPANALVAAEQTARSHQVFAAGPTANATRVPDTDEVRPRGKLSAGSLKKFSVGSETPRQKARMRRPASMAEPEMVVQQVNPADLPPPVQRRGFSVSRPVEVFDAPQRVSSDIPLSRREQKAADKAGRKAAIDSEHAYQNMAPAEILDQRTPGKAREDTPFLVPLIPAAAITTLATYLWFQGAFRLQSLLPLVPIVIGSMVGGIMRMGSRTVDFARVIMAILLTTLATFWGHAAIIEHGPINEATKSNLLWGHLPRVSDPLGMIKVFHDTAEKSLGTAALMFAGLCAAGLISSLHAE
jgi:hypothetical protein